VVEQRPRNSNLRAHGFAWKPSQLCSVPPWLSCPRSVVFLIVIFAKRAKLISRPVPGKATTSAALLVIFVLGALAGEGHLFYACRGSDPDDDAPCLESGTASVRRRLATRRDSERVLLGLLDLWFTRSADRFVDKWELVNPRQAWITVIVIAGIGFVNYVLLKVYGTRGVYVSGFLGGFVIAARRRWNWRDLSESEAHLPAWQLRRFC